MSQSPLIDATTRAFVTAHLHDDVRDLALRPCPTGVDLKHALVQIAGFQRMRTKVPSWTQIPSICYPQQLSLEQCSSEATALYKQRLVARWAQAHRYMADVTGGMGIDTAFLAPCFERIAYVERQAYLCALAQHNFAALGLTHIKVYEDEAKHWLEMHAKGIDLLFVDPARRSEIGRKVVLLADCEPNLQTLVPQWLTYVPQIIVKLSPMLDVTQACHDLPHVQEVHVVAHQGECKELLLCIQRDYVGMPRIICTDLQQDFVYTIDQEQLAPRHYAPTLGRYLYEPHAALMKAGPFRLIAQRLGVALLHVNTRLYTSDNYVKHFPGRTFEILDASPVNRKAISLLMQGITQSNVSLRNFPQSVEAFRKKYKLRDGGDMYLFVTTIGQDQHVAIKCRKVPADK